MVKRRKKSKGAGKGLLSPRVVNWVSVSAVVVLSASIFAGSMTKPVGRDEQMYCTGGVLLSQGKLIYRDFSYPAQMPYHPLLYSLVYRVSGTSHYLLVGRILSSLCDIGVMLCIMGLYRRIFGASDLSGLLMALAGAVLYVFNPLVDYANGYAWNHDVVILCVALSFWLYVTCDPRSRLYPLRIAAIGALLTIASCMRITTVLAEGVFLIMLSVRPAKSPAERIRRILPFVVAAVLVLIWPLSVIARSGQAFFLNLLKFPSLYGAYLRQTGMVHDKLQLTLWALRKPGYLALLVIAVYLCLTLLVLRRRVKIEGADNIVLGGLLVVTFFVIAFIPPTMWRQYMAVPVPFLIIFLAYPMLYIRNLAANVRLRMHFKMAQIVVAGCALVSLASNPVVLSRAPLCLVPEVWVPVELHRVSSEIAREMKAPRRVLTLGPLFALEGGGEIYDELSAGAIVYRIADSLSAQERAVTHTAGPGALGELMGKTPASAVIAGVETEALEKPLIDVATRAGWEAKAYRSGPVAYFRR